MKLTPVVPMSPTFLTGTNWIFQKVLFYQNPWKSWKSCQLLLENIHSSLCLLRNIQELLQTENKGRGKIRLKLFFCNLFSWSSSFSAEEIERKEGVRPTVGLTIKPEKKSFSMKYFIRHFFCVRLAFSILVWSSFLKRFDRSRQSLKLGILRVLWVSKLTHDRKVVSSDLSQC